MINLELDYFTEVGKYFGYPECCINFFKNYETIEELKKQHKYAKYGFVPCPKCSEKMIKNNLKIEDLIKNRICKEPFTNKDASTLGVKNYLDSIGCENHIEHYIK